MWRTAKEIKMDEYRKIDTFDLVLRSSVDRTKHVIYNTMWAYKTKLEEGKLAPHRGLNPRWCVKAGAMDRSIYKAYSEMVRPTSVSVVVAIKCEFFDELCA